MPKIFIILISVIAVSLLLLVALPIYFVKKTFDDIGERVGGGPKDYVNEGLSSAYVFEDEVVSYRPKSTGSIIAANIFSLGTVGRPKWLVGSAVVGADVGSFEVLAQRYGRDWSRFYFEWSEITGADVSSFKPFGYGYAQDANGVWVGSAQIIEQAGLADDAVKAYAERVFSVGDQAFYLDNAPVALAEMPRTEIKTHCRKWFEMNGALWFGAERLALPQTPIKVVDCDGSVRTGPEGEFVEDNKGLLFTSGDTAYLARVTGDLGAAHQFDAVISDAVFFEPDYRENLMLARLATDQFVVVDLSGDRREQVLGRFPEFGDKSLTHTGRRALWLDVEFFVFNEDKSQPLYTAYGKAEKVGSYMMTESKVFSSTFEVVGAHPDTFEVLGLDYALDRNACYAFGRYIGDLPPDVGTAKETALGECRALYETSHVVYDGMRISFEQDFKRVLGGDAAAQGDEFIHDFKLGELRVENLTDAPLAVDPVFWNGIEAWVRSGKAVALDVDRPVLDHGGTHALAPRETVSWSLKVRSDVANLEAGFYVTFDHVGAKRARFGTGQMRFASTYLSGAGVVQAAD